MKKDTKKTKVKIVSKKRTKPSFDSFEVFLKHIFEQNYLFSSVDEKNYYKKQYGKFKKQITKLKKKNKELTETNKFLSDKIR